jgi:hypothetical protein
LFAKTSHTTSLPFKTHLVFLVFAISTVYSFFFDKTNGKPDLYCRISYVTFAIMSLSLSKQTHFGIEVDLSFSSKSLSFNSLLAKTLMYMFFII